jgi:hypothetical protein
MLPFHQSLSFAITVADIPVGKCLAFALASIPMAFICARIPLSDSLYRKLLAACLILVIIRLL